MKWEYKTLEQMGEISRGKSKHRPRNDSRLFGGEYPFVQTADVKAANFYLTEYTQTYNEVGLAQSKLWPKGTLCITIAANIADTAILGIPACFPDSIMGFNAFPNVANTTFVKYCFDILQRDCKQISQGTAQDNLSWDKLSTIQFPCPPLPIQNKIASILSKYDDLIENYQQQIKLLEESAQRLYKEWFVDLHFPNYENTKIVDGIPEGWEKKKLIDIVDVQYGYAFDGSLFNDKKQGMPILRIRNIPNGYSEDYTTEEVSDNYVINDGEIVVGMDGEFHINIWSGGSAYLVQRACCFRPKQEIMRGFILESIYGPIKFFEKTLVGATVAHLGKKHIDSIELLVPTEEKLHVIFSKMLKKRLILLKNIRNLTEARDRLLPKLMSGEIEVE